ncbi:hypothetical protein dsx2_0862 [Desulfovibrio sp. X2]|uniref:hypothetical protein n=1 Tax=Desulfovibrio sp. X2 TaxID=941449 RepID=UPI00035882DD|nr:hypothetical protein [Desulfovibrio sp. X2]EPR37516.1 hypothetical protein dsx2_0862 [Desulfovibrio sp. X2]
MIDPDYLTRIREYMESGRLEAEFADASEERRYAILDFLEQLMDLAELADKTATRVIFKDSYLEMASGVKLQK